MTMNYTTTREITLDAVYMHYVISPYRRHLTFSDYLDRVWIPYNWHIV